MKIEGTNLLLLRMSAFWGSLRWPLDEFQKAEKYSIRWSLSTGFIVFMSNLKSVKTRPKCDINISILNVTQDHKWSWRPDLIEKVI